MSDRISLVALNKAERTLNLAELREHAPQLLAEIESQLYAEIRADEEAGRNPALHRLNVPLVARGRLMRFASSDTPQSAVALALREVEAARGQRGVI
jgi:hypothetical protein